MKAKPLLLMVAMIGHAACVGESDFEPENTTNATAGASGSGGAAGTASGAAGASGANAGSAGAAGSVQPVGGAAGSGGSTAGSAGTAGTSSGGGKGGAAGSGGSAGTSPGGGGGGGTAATGGSGGSGAGGKGGVAGTGGAAGTCDFTMPQQCGAAPDIGTVSGDTGADGLVVTAARTEWKKFWLSENDSSALTDIALTFVATLISPPGMNYDLEIWWDCGDPTNIGSSYEVTGPDKITGKVPDSIGSDARYVWVLVKYVSGSTCGASDQWKLTIAGNKV